MTSADHEKQIDKFERLMLEADNREDRAAFAGAFLVAIAERNAQRGIVGMIEIERKKGLRA